jgi:hypothetical protein
VAHAFDVAHATHAEPLQYFWLPHTAGDDHERQPFASAVQVWTWVPEHWVVPDVAHAFDVAQATHAEPLQYIWLPHKAGADHERQPFASAVQVWT